MHLFDTNFWGVVNGSLVALKSLKESGGALINLGSEVSEAVVPLQGFYSASKHAVKGFTDALRVEVQAAGTRAEARGAPGEPPAVRRGAARSEGGLYEGRGTGQVHGTGGVVARR